MKSKMLLKFAPVAAASGLLGLGFQQSEFSVHEIKKRFVVAAKTPTFNMGHGTKWDYNWDHREPSSLVKPPKPGAEEDPNASLEKAKSKAIRIIVMVRHGQYNLDGAEDSERYLTELGKKQADATGRRLHQLYSHYVSKEKDEDGNVGKPRIRLIKSSMQRASETGSIIHSHLPDVPAETCDLIREGAPCQPDPPIDGWDPTPADFFQEGARIEAGFRKYFRRADASQEETSVDILVCHGNVIRYFVCRALQLDPSAWLRMSVHNGSITVVTVAPSGRVKVSQVGEAGHFTPDMLTFN